MTRANLQRVAVWLGAFVATLAVGWVPQHIAGETYEAGVWSGAGIVYVYNIGRWALGRIR